MQHRAQQAGDRLQRGFALAGGERRAAHAFQQQSLAELDHWQNLSSRQAVVMFPVGATRWRGSSSEA